MKKYLLLLCGVLLSVVSIAQEKKVAVLETVNGTKNVSVLVRNILRSELTKSINDDDAYHAFTRSDIDQLMAEFTFQTDMVSKEQRVKLGEMSGAELVCASKVSKEDDNYFLEASLINLKTGMVENSSSGLLENADLAGINALCKKISLELLGYQQINGNSGGRKIRKLEDRVIIGLNSKSGSPLEGSQAVSLAISKRLGEIYHIKNVNKNVYKNFKKNKVQTTDYDYCVQLILYYNSVRIFVSKKGEGEVARINKFYEEQQKADPDFVQKEVEQIMGALNTYLPQEK